MSLLLYHDDVIKWKHFPRYWPFVWGIHRSPVNSPHKGQWHGALMFSLICAWINTWVNNREAGDLRCHHAHHDVIVIVVSVRKRCPTIYLVEWHSDGGRVVGADGLLMTVIQDDTITLQSDTTVIHAHSENISAGNLYRNITSTNASKD